jgi:hypothetical protein
MLRTRGRSRLEFISEPIVPDHGSADAAAMSRGEAGLPSSFTWRGRHYSIASVLQTWKGSAPEGGRGEVYLRRHWFRVQTSSGELMVLYCLRQAKPGQPRWWLYELLPA